MGDDRQDKPRFDRTVALDGGADASLAERAAKLEQQMASAEDPAQRRREEPRADVEERAEHDGLPFVAEDAPKPPPTPDAKLAAMKAGDLSQTVALVGTAPSPTGGPDPPPTDRPAQPPTGPAQPPTGPAQPPTGSAQRPAQQAPAAPTDLSQTTVLTEDVTAGQLDDLSGTVVTSGPAPDARAPFDLAGPDTANAPPAIPGAPWSRAQAEPPTKALDGTSTMVPRGAQHATEPPADAEAEHARREAAREAEQARLDEERARAEAEERREAERAREEAEAEQARKEAEARREREAEAFRREQEQARKAEQSRREARKKERQKTAAKLRKGMYGGFG